MAVWPFANFSENVQLHNPWVLCTIFTQLLLLLLDYYYYYWTTTTGRDSLEQPYDFCYFM